MERGRWAAALAGALLAAGGGCAGAAVDRRAAPSTSAAPTTIATVASTIPDHTSGGAAPVEVAFGRDGADTALDVALRNYAVLGVPARIRGPQVWFTVTIVGGRTHELEIVDADGDPVAAIDPFRASDGEQTLAAVLEPGTYTVHCLVRSGTRTHASMGMRRDVVVE